VFKFKKNELNKKKVQGNVSAKIIFLSGVLIIFVTGVASTFYFKQRAEAKEREELIKISDVASAAVNFRRLTSLEGNDEDLKNPDYQRLKEQLILINESLKSFNAQWIYLMKNENKKWIFSVDPLDENSPDYTAPGTVYEDYPKDLDLIFQKNETILVGPYSDKWGSFISAFSPIKNLENGEILGVLGVDIDAKILELNVWKSIALPIAISFFALILWVLFFIYRNKKNKHEKEIRSKEEQFRSITETIDDIIFRMDLKGQIIYISPSVENITGFLQEEVLKNNFIDFFPSLEYPKTEELFERIFQGEKVGPLNILANCKNGKKIQAELDIVPIQEDGKILEIQGLIRDVTQKKENAEKIGKQNEELKKSQTAILNILEDIEEEKENVAKERDKINAILHSIGDGVFVVGADLKIIMVNEVTSKISGYSSSELIGEKYDKVLKFIFEKNEKENEEFIKEAIKTGETKEMANHTMLIRKDGNRLPVADSAAPLKNKEGKVIGCVIVFRDVSKEREIDRIKSEFVSVASHQLRTPLTEIKWFSELLLENKKSKLSKEQQDFIKEIHTGNERMISLVNDLLNVSRIETGKKFEIEKKKTDMIKLIKEVIKEQTNEAKNKGIEIVCDAGHPSELFLNVDENKIRQIFQNLLSNAVKYSSKGERVIFECEEEKERATFSIKDSGLGIPKDQQSRIFEKFFRASNVLMTGAEGTGLGLYIAKSIVEAHGGKISFESADKKGTTFFVSLPKI